LWTPRRRSPRGVSSDPQAELHDQKSKNQLGRSRQIIVLAMTPQQNNDRRNDQKRDHRSANYMRNDSKCLMSKSSTEHKLDQHRSNGNRDQPPQTPSAAIRSDLVRLNPAPRSENAY